MADALERSALRQRLRERGVLLSQERVTLAAPIPEPGVILSAGMNFRAHLEEMNTPVPKQPTAFIKSSAAVIGPGEAIRPPKSAADMVDWEGEFSAVIGRPCHNVSAAEALDYVAGYTLINDVSARDWVAPVFSATGTMGPILAWEANILGKQFPTFCPLGPVIVTKDEIPDPDDVDLETRLNGQVMQKTNTSDLVFGVARLIEHFSRFYRFRPGDVITTGSPAGVGYGRNPKVFMKAGDLIEVEAMGIGVLANPVGAPL
jgi:2-keto-4-pentenoate hydratase/2-oxohepta-3-ene-1,7-dioic acid hydratase in catechol pathway